MPPSPKGLKAFFHQSAKKLPITKSSFPKGMLPKRGGTNPGKSQLANRPAGFVSTRPGSKPIVSKDLPPAWQKVMSDPKLKQDLQKMGSAASKMSSRKIDSTLPAATAQQKRASMSTFSDKEIKQAASGMQHPPQAGRSSSAYNAAKAADERLEREAAERRRKVQGMGKDPDSVEGILSSWGGKPVTLSKAKPPASYDKFPRSEASKQLAKDAQLDKANLAAKKSIQQAQSRPGYDADQATRHMTRDELEQHNADQARLASYKKPPIKSEAAARKPKNSRPSRSAGAGFMNSIPEDEMVAHTKSGMAVTTEIDPYGEKAALRDHAAWEKRGKQKEAQKIKALLGQKPATKRVVPELSSVFYSAGEPGDKFIKGHVVGMSSRGQTGLAGSYSPGHRTKESAERAAKQWNESNAYRAPLIKGPSYHARNEVIPGERKPGGPRFPPRMSPFPKKRK
jgi:hypothetical protein